MVDIFICRFSLRTNEKILAQRPDLAMSLNLCSALRNLLFSVPSPRLDNV